MHIGLIGVVGGIGADLFEDNIGDALSNMGHQVSRLGAARLERGGRLATRVGALTLQAFPDVESRFHNRLSRRALDRGCDAVITTDANLSPDTVGQLRRNGVPVALWFPDSVTNLGRQRMLAAPFSAMFFKDPLLVQRLRDMLGVPAYYLPEACNPRWHRPVGPAGVERTIVVVGNTYLSRLMLIRRLHQAGIPLTLYGSPPPRFATRLLPPELHVRPGVFREAKSRVFRAAAGVLNNLHPAEMHGVNCRLFEATAAGAAVLCEERPALATLYDGDREIVPFRDFAELVTRARELLDDSRRTEEIGDAATKRAHSEHTYDHRLPSILERLA